MGDVDKDELAGFLRSRRDRLSPREVGLPAGPRRRTPGLRREEVAVLAHISTEYYVRLEQARAPRPSADVLAGIAGALRLSAAETEHLHLLAGTAPQRRHLHQRQVRTSVLALLQRVPSTAGIVLSAGFEVLAWNDLAAALMEDFALRPPGDRNLARRAFLPERSGITDDQPLYGISDLAHLRRQVVVELRAARTRYPADPVIHDLVAELLGASAPFAELWQRRDVDPVPALTKTFDHPVVGPVTLDCDALHLAEQDQTLVLYTAPADSRAAEALAFLGALGAQPLTAP